MYRIDEKFEKTKKIQTVLNNLETMQLVVNSGTQLQQKQDFHLTINDLVNKDKVTELAQAQANVVDEQS